MSTGTPAKAPSLKPGQKRVVTARLLGSRSKDGVLLLPTLQDDIEDTLTSSDVKAGAHTLVSLMKDTEEFLQRTRDFHARNCRHTSCDKSPACAALFFHLKGTSTKSNNTWTQLTNAITGVTSLLFMTDTAAMQSARQSSKEEDLRNLEIMQGVAREQQTKPSTKLIVVTQLTHLQQILRLLSNITLFHATLFKFDPTKDDPDCPILHSMAHQLSELLSDPDFLEWYDTLLDLHRGAFLHWLVERIEFMLQVTLMSANDTKSGSKLIAGAHSQIPVRPQTTVEDAISNAISTIREYIEGSTTEIPVGYLFRNSPIYATLSEKRHNQGGPSGPSGRKAAYQPPGHKDQRQRYNTPPRDASDVNTLPARPAPTVRRTVGEIICLGKTPLPPKVEGVPSLCVPHIKDDSLGCNMGAACKYDHPADIQGWHPSVLSAWKSHVARTPSISWNSRLAPNM